MKKKIEYAWVLRDLKGFILGGGGSKAEALAAYDYISEFAGNCLLCYTRLEHIFTNDGEYIRTEEFTEDTYDLIPSN